MIKMDEHVQEKFSGFPENGKNGVENGASMSGKIGVQSEISPDQNKNKNEVEQSCEYEKTNSLSVSNWFFTFLIQDIPIIGEIALLIWAFQKRNATGKRQYAVARLIYKLIFDIIAVVILFIMYSMASGALNKLIEYMESI